MLGIDSRSRLDTKTIFPDIGIPIIKMRLSYIYNGNPYAGKTVHLYYDSPQ